MKLKMRLFQIKLIIQIFSKFTVEQYRTMISMNCFKNKSRALFYNLDLLLNDKTICPHF